MSIDKCPFCNMGQERRMRIWRLTNDLSRARLQQLLNDFRPKRKPSICPKCGKNCGNPGMLAMHLKSPGKKYRNKHKEYDNA